MAIAGVGLAAAMGRSRSDNVHEVLIVVYKRFNGIRAEVQRLSFFFAILVYIMRENASTLPPVGMVYGSSGPKSKQKQSYAH